MEFYHLKSFVAVAEEGNLTRAAERLFSSQPAVSAHIKALEEELGVSLFDRNARGMSLTDDGEALLENAREILAKVGGLANRARDLQASPRGKLAVGVINDGDRLPLYEISETLATSHPNIQLEFIHSNSGAISKALLEGELDVGFFEGVVESPLLSSIEIGVSNIVVVGSQAEQEVFASPDWKSLEALPWVFNTPECSYHAFMNRICQAHELELNKRYITDHEATCLQFVKKGLAISIANKDAIRKELENGELIAWKGLSEQLPINLLCQSRRIQERPIEAFLQAAKSIVEPNA